MSRVHIDPPLDFQFPKQTPVGKAKTFPSLAAGAHSTAELVIT